AKKADEARLIAVAAVREAARAMMPVRVAENLKLRAERELAAAEAALASEISIEARALAEDAKTKALTRIAELQVQWAAAKGDLQPKLDAVAPARAAAAAAEAVRAAAAQLAEEAARELEPVLDLYQSQGPAPLRPAGLSADLGEPDHDRRRRSSCGHTCL